MIQTTEGVTISAESFERLRMEWDSAHKNPNTNREPVPTHISEGGRVFHGEGWKVVMK